MALLLFSYLQVITGQAAVQRCNATVNFFAGEKSSVPPTVNDADLHEHFRRVAGDMLGIKKVNDMPPLMGCEDFAFYQEALHGYFFFLGMEDASSPERLPSMHSPYFRVNEDVLPYGAALHASLATTYLLKFQQDAQAVGGKHHDEL